MMKFTWLLMLTTAALFMTALTASAQFAFDGDGPIKVDGDKIEYNGDETILTGQVEITQGATRILADTVVLYRNMLATGQPGDVSRIVATGNFYYIAPEQKVRGDQGVYVQASNQITVTGNVVLGDETGNVGTTDKFVYDLNTKQAVLTGTCTGRKCADGSRPSLIIDNSTTPGSQ